MGLQTSKVLVWGFLLTMVQTNDHDQDINRAVLIPMVSWSSQVAHGLICLIWLWLLAHYTPGTAFDMVPYISLHRAPVEPLFHKGESPVLTLVTCVVMTPTVQHPPSVTKGQHTGVSSFWWLDLWTLVTVYHPLAPLPHKSQSTHSFTSHSLFEGNHSHSEVW